MSSDNKNVPIDYNVKEDRSLTGRTSSFWTRTDDGDNDAYLVDVTGHMDNQYRYLRCFAARPILQSSEIFSKIFSNKMREFNGAEEVVLILHHYSFYHLNFSPS